MGRESLVIKDRKCQSCQKLIKTTAQGIKVHYNICRKEVKQTNGDSK